MDNKKIIYRYKNITIEKADRKDRIEIFKTLLYDRSDNYQHSYQYATFRRILKVEVNSLFNDDTFIVRKDKAFVGYFVIEPANEEHGPNAEEVYLVKEAQKSKALACIIDCVMNHMYKDQNIITFSERYPGFKKIVREFYDFVEIRAVLSDTAERVERICKGAEYHG